MNDEWWQHLKDSSKAHPHHSSLITHHSLFIPLSNRASIPTFMIGTREVNGVRRNPLSNRASIPTDTFKVIGDLVKSQSLIKQGINSDKPFEELLHYSVLSQSLIKQGINSDLLRILWRDQMMMSQSLIKQGINSDEKRKKKLTGRF
jgi:hypothetical protein